MTTFEGMCIGFLAGVVGTLLCVLPGSIIDSVIVEEKGDEDNNNE